MYGYIYKTTNLINGKIYIGRHKAAQFEPHKYIGSGAILKSAIEKYGFENFKCELLDIADDKESLNEKEIYWIAYYRKNFYEQLYNISKGGEAICDGLKKIELEGNIKFVPVEELDRYLIEGWKVSSIETKKRNKQNWKETKPEAYKAAKKRARAKWKEKHPDRVREANLKCMRNRPEKNKEAQARYLANEENRKKHNERVKQNYQANKKQKQEYYRNYFNDPEKKRKHAEAVKKYREKQKQLKAKAK